MAERTASLEDFDAEFSASTPSPDKKTKSEGSTPSQRSYLDYPGGWAAVELKVNEAKPAMKYPGFSMEVSKHVDGDLQMTRDWAINHTLYFDPVMAPEGGYALSTSAQNEKSNIQAQYCNGTIVGEARHKHNDFSFGLLAQLQPQNQGMMMMMGGAVDEYKGNVKYKGSSFSLSSAIGTSGMNLAYLKTIFPGISAGAKISRSHPQGEVNNSYFLRWRNRSKKDTLQMMSSNDLMKNEFSLSYMKKATPHSHFVTKFQYSPVQKTSSWWLGYSFMFPHTGTQINAMIDSDFKVALGSTFRLPNIEIAAITFYGEVDHMGGKHKFSSGLQLNIPSSEQSKAQEEMMRQHMARSGL